MLAELIAKKKAALAKQHAHLFPVDAFVLLALRQPLISQAEWDNLWTVAEWLGPFNTYGLPKKEAPALLASLQLSGLAAIMKVDQDILWPIIHKELKNACGTHS